jgi:hypothetical protein
VPLVISQGPVDRATTESVCSITMTML